MAARYRWRHRRAVTSPFIPVLGQLDDAIVAALALRYALRAGGPELLREHWPGPTSSLDIVVRLAFRTRV